MKTIFTLAFVFVFSTALLSQPENTQNDLRSESRKTAFELRDQQQQIKSEQRLTAFYKTANVVFRLDSMLEEEYNENTLQWEAEDLEHVFYAFDHTCVAELDFDYNTSGRDSSAWSWYTFDAQGNFTQDITAYYNNNGWDTAWKEVMTYDAANRYTGMVEYSYNNGQWESDYKSTYTYNSNGHLTLEERFDWDNNTWEIYYRKEYNHHGDGRINNTVDFYFSGTMSIQDDSVYYQYNASNLVIQRMRYKWDINQWVFDHQYLYTYDPNNYLQARISLYYFPSTGWDTSYRYLYNHNAQGYLLDRVEQDWMNSQWRNYYKDVFTYNMDFVYPQIAANPYYLDDISVMYLTSLGYDWDENTMAWENDYRETIYWSSTNIGIHEQESTNLKVYPNPTDETIHVQSVFNTAVTLKLYSMSGTLLQMQILNSPHQSIDVSSYTPGLYILMFEYLGNTTYKKIQVY